MIPTPISSSGNLVELREYLRDRFTQIEHSGDNVISISTKIPNFFKGITSPNEFAGPLVEAWAHIHLARILEKYQPATTRKQEFADAAAEYNGGQILINIKAKDRERESRSRINLSSLKRHREHYSRANPAPFYVLICQYEWRLAEYELSIIIEGFKYTFNLLEIPASSYKIEGSYEGSYRIYISPIPDAAKTETRIYSSMTPREFLMRLEELRTGYDTRRASRGSTRNRG